MLSVTPTKMADYQICPHKYKLKHLDRTPGFASASPALSFGISMHRALREVHNAKVQGLSFDEAFSLLEGCWEMGGYADEQQSEEYLIKGSGALVRYCEIYPNPTEETIGTEVYLSCVIKSGGLAARLGCKADRLSVDCDGTLEVVDYKTNASGAVPTPEFLAADLPTFLYYALARASYPEYQRVRVSFLNVLTLAKSSVELDRQTVAENKERLLECLRDLSVSKLEPHPSEVCAWCPFQEVCPATGRIVDFDAIT